MLPRSRQAGFTLLEMMVVIFILALTASLTLLTLGRNDQSQVDSQARQLLTDFTFARDLALNSSRLVGWHSDAEGYYFSRRSSRGDWEKYTSRGLPQRRWPEGLILMGSDSPENPTAGHLEQPRLVFFPSGALTPARLTLQLGEARRSLQVAASRLELLDRETVDED